MNLQETSLTKPRRRFLLIPEYDPYEPDKRYPGGIEPGSYTCNELVALLRRNKENPEAIQFIADMLEE